MTMYTMLAADKQERQVKKRDVRGEWAQGRHCPCRADQQSLQVAACQWLAYTAAIHSCSSAAAAAHATTQMTSCALRQTTHSDSVSFDIYQVTVLIAFATAMLGR